MSLTSFQSRPAIEGAFYRPNETLYQLQSSFHTQSTEPEPTARARRAEEDEAAPADEVQAAAARRRRQQEAEVVPACVDITLYAIEPTRSRGRRRSEIDVHPGPGAPGR